MSNSHNNYHGILRLHQGKAREFLFSWNAWNPAWSALRISSLCTCFKTNYMSQKQLKWLFCSILECENFEKTKNITKTFFSGIWKWWSVFFCTVKTSWFSREIEKSLWKTNKDDTFLLLKHWSYRVFQTLTLPQSGWSQALTSWKLTNWKRTYQMHTGIGCRWKSSFGGETT